MIFTTVDVYDFHDAFVQRGRVDNFTHAGREVLFAYLEDFASVYHPIELDVIALCCEYGEDEPRGIAQAYQIDIEGMDDDEAAEAVREYLIDQGAYIGETDGAIVHRQF